MVQHDKFSFTMLDGLIKCQKTFKRLERLEEHDPDYLPKNNIPTLKIGIRSVRRVF